MKKITFYLSCFLLFPALAFAQVDEEEVLLHQLNMGIANIALVNQSGAYNDVYIFQVNAQTALVNQEGLGNEVHFELEGYDNRVWVSQKGDGNSYQLLLDGENNSIGLSQKGDYNSVIQDLKQARNLELVMYQVGNNNLIEHREYNALGQGIPVEIKQSGNGLHLIINSIQNL